MINLAVSSKVTLSFRSTLFLSSSSLSSSEHPLSSRSYQEWDIAVRLEKSEVQSSKFSISPTVGGCELGGLRSSSPSQGQ